MLTGGGAAKPWFGDYPITQFTEYLNSQKTEDGGAQRAFVNLRKMVSVEWFDKAKVHVAMMLVGAGYGGYYVLTKASLSGGVDPFLFSTYRDGIGCLTLFLYASCFERYAKFSACLQSLIVCRNFVTRSSSSPFYKIL